MKTLPALAVLLVLLGLGLGSAPAAAAPGLVDVVVHIQSLTVNRDADNLLEGGAGYSDPFVDVGVEGVEGVTTWGRSKLQDNVQEGDHATSIESNTIIFKNKEPDGMGRVSLRVMVLDWDNISANDPLSISDQNFRNGDSLTMPDQTGATITLEVTFIEACTAVEVKAADTERDILVVPPSATRRGWLHLNVDETSLPTSLTVTEMIPSDLGFQNPNPIPVISTTYVDGEEFTVAEWTFTGPEITDREIEYELVPPISPQKTYQLFGYSTTNLGTCTQRGDLNVDFPVGGVAELPDVSGSSTRKYIALAGLAAAALVALSTGGWYARRRWLR